MSVLDGVITVARGLRIAPRGVEPDGAGWDYRVVEVAPVTVPTSPALEARTLDGIVWRRLWLLPQRLVIDFLHNAVVEVRDLDGAIVFDRALPPEVEQHLLLDHLLPLVLARLGDVVLHGAMLSCDQGTAVLLGPSGSGKSTLTAYAGAHGWTVAGDDGAVLGLESAVTVEPTYPTVRLTLEALGLLGLPSDEGSPVVGKRRLRLDGPVSSRQEPRALNVIAILEPAPAGHAAAFTRIHGAEAHAALFGSTFHADLRQGELLRNAVDVLGRVAEEIPVGRLTVPRGLPGLAAAERLVREEAAAR